MLMVSLPGYFFTICFVVKSQVVCQLIARIIINVNICIEAVNIFSGGICEFYHRSSFRRAPNILRYQCERFLTLPIPAHSCEGRNPVKLRVAENRAFYPKNDPFKLIYSPVIVFIHNIINGLSRVIQVRPWKGLGWKTTGGIYLIYGCPELLWVPWKGIVVPANAGTQCNKESPGATH